MRSLLAALMFLAGCSGIRPPVTTTTAVADGGPAWREVTREIAVGYCTVHRLGEPLILAAEGAWPPMTMIATAADLFCASVMSHSRQNPSAVYVIRPDGFEVR